MAASAVIAIANASTFLNNENTGKLMMSCGSRANSFDRCRHDYFVVGSNSPCPSFIAPKSRGSVTTSPKQSIIFKGKLLNAPLSQSSASTTPVTLRRKNTKLQNELWRPSPLFSADSDTNDESSNENEPKERDTGPKNKSTSQNEFSRTIRVSKWFAGGNTGSIDRGRNNQRSGNKSMNLSITATSSERSALAARFRLSNISALSAELVIQPTFGVGLGGGRGTGGGGGGGRANDNECIEARGTVSAQVTQNCVRTNEEFDVDLEFSFDTIFRAMAVPGSSSSEGGDANLSAGEQAALDAASKLDDAGPRKKKGGKKQRGVKGVGGGQNLDTMGMKELQDVLMDYEVTEEVIEDEGCFCTDGIVDAGEIVAQMFRSKLDPYPKKPGSVSLYTDICHHSIFITD